MLVILILIPVTIISVSCVNALIRTFSLASWTLCVAQILMGKLLVFSTNVHGYWFKLGIFIKLKRNLCVTVYKEFMSALYFGYHWMSSNSTCLGHVGGHWEDVASGWPQAGWTWAIKDCSLLPVPGKCVPIVAASRSCLKNTVLR